MKLMNTNYKVIYSDPKNLSSLDDLNFIPLVDSPTGEQIPANEECKFAVSWNTEGLCIYYIAKDKHIWGKYKHRDDPIYDEEVVEIFISGGKQIPKKYYEIQASPNGVIFDALINNPTGSRIDEQFEVDISWDCNLRLDQKIISTKKNKILSGVWKTRIIIPFGEIDAHAGIGEILRANIFRIDGYPEQNSYQSWIPTMKSPANFHVPEVFGTLELT